MKNEIFALEKASVSLNGRPVFSDLNFRIYRNEVFGIICGSDSEQASMIALFRGLCHIDGRLRMDGQNVPEKAADSLLQRNVYVIDSRMNLISSLSVAENIFIFADTRLLVHENDYLQRTQAYITQFRLDLDPAKPIDELTNHEALLVSLLKAYAEHRKIIVLAGMSNCITDNELYRLQLLIRRMIAEQFTFVVIDSIEADVFRYADEILVIKNNTSVACFETAFFDRESFYRYMLAGKKTTFHDDLLTSDFESEDFLPCLEISELETEDLDHISLSAAKGELLKILCMDERSLRGFQRLGSSIYTLRGGSITIGSITANLRKPVHFSRQSLLLAPETPWQNAILPNMSVRDNLLLGFTGKAAALWMKPGYADNIDQFIRSVLQIEKPLKKAYHFDPPIRQQIIYSRFLLSAPKVLVIDRPFTETDLQIRSITVSMIKALQDRGVTVLMLTTSPANLAYLEGDVLYCKDGRFISEEEMYRFFYTSE